MWIQICARGGHKNGTVWRILNVPQYVIINLEFNNFKDNFPNNKNT